MGNWILRRCAPQNDSGDERHPEYLDFIGRRRISSFRENGILRPDEIGTQNDDDAMEEILPPI